MTRGRLGLAAVVLAAVLTSLSSPARAAVVSQFEGLSNADNGTLAGAAVLPPDNALAVGPSHVMELVNIVGRVSSRTGTAISSFRLRDFFALDATADESDPRAYFDALSGRWFAVYLQFNDITSSSSIVLVVSTTGDPTGTFCRYRVGNPTSETFVQDFPMFGVSDDKIVVSYNGFTFSPGNFIGSGYYVINKADALACAPTLRSTRVAPSLALFSPLPAQRFGPLGDVLMVSHSTSGRIDLLTVTGVPGVTPVSTSTRPLTIRPWLAPPAAPQAGTSVLLDTGDERVLSAVWHNTLWISGAEACTPPGDSAVRSCLRLIEISTANGTVLQDFTFGASGQYYSYPAVHPDSLGNVVAVFTSSSSSSFASLQSTGRLVSDPQNTLRPSAVLRAGGGAQTHSSGRLGDYSTATIDPVDPLSVWVSGEYIRSSGSENWGTAVAQLRMSFLAWALSKNGQPCVATCTFTAADTLALSLLSQATTPTGDLYILLQTPDQAIHLLGQAGSVTLPVITIPLINGSLNLPAGNFNFIALFVTPGTDPGNSVNWLTIPAVVPFVFGP